MTGTELVENQGRTTRFKLAEDQLKAAFDGIAKQMSAMHLRWASDGCAQVNAEYRLLGKRLQVIGYNKTARPLQCSILWG